MDFKTLSRRQLQALCKKNKIPANITSVAMANALTSLHLVEGIEEILNPEILKSPMVPPTGGRTRTAKVVSVSVTSSAAPTIPTRRRADAASTSVRRKIDVSSNKSLDEIEDKKSDISVKTPASQRKGVRETSIVKPVYNTRRSARLAKKIEESKERSEAIKIESFTDETDEIVEVEMKETSVDQSDTSEITVLDNFKKMLTLSEEIEVLNDDEYEANSNEKSDISNGRCVAITSIEQRVVSRFKTATEVPSNVNEVETMPSTGDESIKASTKEDTEMNSNANEETKVGIEKELIINSDVKEEAKASIEKDSGINCNVDEEAKASVDEESEINSNVDDETKATTEKDTKMNFDMDEEAKEYLEDNEMNSNEGDETKASTEKDTGMNLNVEGEAKASIEMDSGTNSNVEEEAKVASINKDTGINSNVEGEAKTSIEKETAMNFNEHDETEESFEVTYEDDETKASTEDTELNSNVDEETKVSTEKDTEKNPNVDDEAKKASFEVTERNSNEEEAKAASIDKNTGINSNVEGEANTSIEKETGMNFNGHDETEESFEVNEMNSYEDDETKASTEDTELNSNVDEETEVSTEKDMEMNSNVDDEAKKASFEVTERNSNEDNGTKVSIEDTINSLADDETKVPNVEDTVMNFEEDGEIVIADLKVVHLGYVEFNHDEQDTELEAYAEDIENDGHEEYDISENETSNDEDSDMSDENDTSSNIECDMSDDYQEEFCAPEVGGKDEPVCEKDNLESGSGDDDSATEFNQEEMNIPEVEIQDGDEESEISDENEISDDKEFDMSHRDELVDDEAYVDPGFAGDISATKFNQEMAVFEDVVVPKVEIQNEDELLNSEGKTNVPVTELMAISEDVFVPKVESQDQDELLNSKARRESDPVHIVAPLINDDFSSIEPLKKYVSKTPLAKSTHKAPRTVQRLTQILKDDKENVGSGRKSVILKDGKPKENLLEDSSIKELTKMLKQKWNISKQQKEDGKEDEDIFIKATTTRPALKTLSENCMGVELQN